MKFLKQVADYYLSRQPDLHNTIFVFPNRRSAMFMRKYMRNGVGNVSFLPRMVSITYFTQTFNDTALATEQELLFMLYRVYCRVLRRHGRGEQIPDFDNFSFWGNILINDFSEIDAYLTDPSQLFRNLSGLKKIEANYLTEEQIKAISMLWGNIYARHADTETFWRDVSPTAEDGSLQAEFISLWMVMDELYREFNRELAAQKPVPLAYSGLQSKLALERIKEMDAADFGGKRYVFIGFNVLSASRVLMLQRLKDLGIAEFFWDTAFADGMQPLSDASDGSPVPAIQYVKALERQFPMPPDFTAETVTAPPDIEIISVPSNVAQAKVAGRILREWHEEWIKEGDPFAYRRKLLDTAVVLPDAALLLPMLHSIPTEMEPVNVTMGIPYSSTPFASLLSAIISMQMRARCVKDDITYYYQDVEQVIIHPHIVLIAPEQTKRLKERIATEHIYNVPASMICSDYPELAFIFTPVRDSRKSEQVHRYMHTLIDTIAERFKESIKTTDLSEYYEFHLIEGYRRTVDELFALAARYGVEMRNDTFFRMIEHQLASTDFDFIGKPLKGLQIMGVMDTRALDFDNVIILSMNEGVFPKRNFTPSLIPAALRRGYYLPTQEQEESTSAYQFYRLLSRARNVRLIYDSRVKGLSTGEMSRYLSQWLHLEHNAPIGFSSVQIAANPPVPKTIAVNKTDTGVAEMLSQFGEGGRLFLSASALKVYLKCPLHFYLKHVKGLRVDDKTMDFIDSASYGTALHAMAEKLYLPYADQLITPDTIDHILRSNDLYRQALLCLDEKYYNRRFSDRIERMPGEGKLMAQMMVRSISKMLQIEKDQKSPFTFVAAEYGEHKPFVWKVNDRYTVQLHISIDRIDRIDDGSLRFIDYKTGSDELGAPSVDSIFSNSKLSGIFQLLMYCHAYADIFGFEGRIQPKIYKLQTITTDGLPDLRFNKKPLTDYRDADADGGFRQQLEDVIDRIFETENRHPFVQAPIEKTDDYCLRCHFTELCGRNPKPKKY